MKDLLNNLLFNSRFIFQDAPKENVTVMPEQVVEGEVPATEAEAEAKAEQDVESVQAKGKKVVIDMSDEDVEPIVASKPRVEEFSNEEGSVVRGENRAQQLENAKRAGILGVMDKNPPTPVNFGEATKGTATEAGVEETRQAIVSAETLEETDRLYETAISLLKDGNNQRAIARLSITDTSVDQGINKKGFNVTAEKLTQRLMDATENVLKSNDPELIASLQVDLRRIQRFVNSANLARREQESAYSYRHDKIAERVGKTVFDSLVQKCNI
ncbi:hypothetical protein KKA95_01415 [Patescibacteria group bacterium]|nr:hypothetical protein [Patescibacteria group bacterium]